MPSIPSGDQRVRQAPLPSIRQNPNLPIEAFGGGAALTPMLAAGQIIKGHADVIQQMKDDEIKLELSELRRGMNEKENALIRDPKTGAINRRGKDAVGVYTELGTAFDEFVKGEIEGRSPFVQQQYLEMADVRRQSILGWAAGHENQEAQQWKKEEYGASIESSKNRAASSANEADVSLELMMIYDQVAERGGDEGWGKEHIAATMNAHETDIHNRVVNKLLSEEMWGEANLYFDKYKDGINPEVRRVLNERIESQSLLGEAYKLADEYTSPRVELSREEGVQAAYYVEPTEAEALKRVDGYTGPNADKIKAKVPSLIKQRFALKKKAREEMHDAAFTHAVKTLEETRSLDAVKQDSEMYLETFTLTDRNRLEAREKRLQSGQDVKTNPLKLTEFYALSERELETMSDGEFLEWAEHLSKREMENAAKHMGRAKKPEEFKAWASDNDLLIKGMIAGNIGGLEQGDTMKEVKKSPTKSKAYQEFKGQIDAARAAFNVNKKRDPDQDELQKMIDRAALEQVRVIGYIGSNEWWTWDYDKRVSAMVDEDYEKLEFGATDVELTNLRQEAFESGDQIFRTANAMTNREFYNSFPERVNRAYVELKRQASSETLRAALTGK